MEREGVDRRLVARLAAALEAREEVTRGDQALSHHFDFLPQLDEMDAARRHAAAAEHEPRP